MIKKVKNTLSWPYVIEDHNGKGIARMFCVKELEKSNQTEFKIEKVINYNSK